MNSEQKWIAFCQAEGISRGRLAGSFECEMGTVLDAKTKARGTPPRLRRDRPKQAVVAVVKTTDIQAPCSVQG